MAHAAMLAAKGILSQQDADALVAGLEEILSDLKSGMPALRKAAYALTIGLFGWHVVSGVYYIYYLISFVNAF